MAVSMQYGDNIILTSGAARWRPMEGAAKANLKARVGVPTRQRKPIFGTYMEDHIQKRSPGHD
jgi:hypothetical protein